MFRGAAEQCDECAETDAADDVRTHRTPRIRGEMVFGRKNLADHRIQAIEENLGHAPQGERGCQRHGFRAAVHIQSGEQRRAQRHQNRHCQQHGDGERDELVEKVDGFVAEALSKEIEELVTKRITIPRFGNLQQTESLNVATATAIVLSEFKRRVY